MHQPMRELRDRKGVDQVEEQFDVGDPGFVSVAFAQEAGRAAGERAGWVAGHAVVPSGGSGQGSARGE